MMSVQTVLSSHNQSWSAAAAAAGSDEVHAMSSLDLHDVMDDFSQMHLLSVVVACLLIVCLFSSHSLPNVV